MSANKWTIVFLTRFAYQPIGDGVIAGDGEPIIDKDTNVLYMHDGSQAGGNPLQMYATNSLTDTTDFDGILNGDDTTVQKALDKIDDAGSIGPQGNQGDQGFQGTAGGIMNWEGAWASDHGTYNVDDVVENNGSTYVCVLQHTAAGDKEPPNLTYWNLVSAAGDQGTQGDQGN